MGTPKRGSDISREWLEVIISQYEAKTNPGASVQVTSFQVSPGAKPGENLGSEVVKVRAEGQVCGRGHQPQHTTRQYSFFMKFLSGSEFERQMASSHNAHLRELLIYSDIIGELNAFQARKAGDKYRINIPEFVYGICTADEYVLVMEDLSPAGYVMKDKYEGLNLQQALMSVDRLARVHAISHAYSKNHNFHEKYPSFEHNSFLDIFYKATGFILYDGVMKAAEQRTDQYEHILSKMVSNRESLLQQFANLFMNSENTKVTCLAHGDFWTNNIMFLTKEDGGMESPPQDIMLIDWGITMWRNPVLDLQYFIHTSTSLSLRRDHLEEILHHYQSIFQAATTDLGARVDNWEFEEFMVEWKRTRLFGFFMGLLNNMVCLTEAGKTFNKREYVPVSATRTKIEAWLGKIIGPGMMYLFTSFEFFSRYTFRNAFDAIIDELVSWNNDILQVRIFDLMTEAYDNGVLEA